jgi:hypothetical protein
MTAYLDACPKCPPGIPDASPSLAAPETVPGGKVTAHQCGTCKTAWNTLWQNGWPVDRMTAPVTLDATKQTRSAA